MRSYFSIILDKSALQSLKKSEAKWLFHHFRVNLPPVFFAELIGDLKKKSSITSTGDPKGDVRMMAGKISSHSIDLNALSTSLVELELSGRAFPLDGRPIIDHAEPVPMPDGSYGMLIDEVPMQRVLDRWTTGQFDEMEIEFANIWRKRLAEIDLEAILRGSKGQRYRKAKDFSDVSGFVDALIFKSGSDYANLTKWMTINGVSPTLQKLAIYRWNNLGRPAAVNFAPYTAYLARVEIFFFIGVSSHIISTRSSNDIDFEYFKYLPFCKVFCSADNLHRDLFSMFSSPKQIFIYGKDMKVALKELVEYYDALSAREKATGSVNYANYPPTGMDNAITCAFDLVIPDWRDRATAPRPRRDPEEDARTFERLKPIMDALKRHSDRKNNP